MGSIEHLHLNESAYETKRRDGETTWDDVAALKDQMPSPTEVAARREAVLEQTGNMTISDDELIALTAKWGSVEVDKEALENATLRNGNPNSYSTGLFIGSGNLPMSDENVYRHVGSSAIVDLMSCGYVRNKREAVGALGLPGKNGFGTGGAVVYWNGGNSRKKETADLVIEASKDAAGKGYVTKDDVLGIWVTDKNTGQPVNLIDGKDHAGLEMTERSRQ